MVMDHILIKMMAMNDTRNKIAENCIYTCTYIHCVDEETGGVYLNIISMLISCFE
jgi:hypothetical protein